MTNHMSSSNADSMIIASSVDLLQRDSDARSKCLHNDETKVISIIDLLTQTSTLKKEKSKDHSWKEVILELIRRLRNVSERKIESQDTFIAKNVQKLKTFVQLLNKQLQTQENTRFTFKTSSWVDVAREEATMRKQRFRDDLSSLRKRREILMKIVKRKEMKKIQKRSIDQIFQEIANVSMTQSNLIVSLRKLESEDITLHVMSSKAQAVLEKFQAWVKKIASSAHVMRRSFVILAHDVRITLNTSNQKTIIKRLIKNNARLHEDLEMLRIAWFKKIVESEKTHSSLIVEIAIETMMNRLLDVNMLNSYQECSCELFEKNCCITQCYRCFDFDHMTRFCKNKERCFKCADKHHIERCVVSMNRRRCANCNDSHELWRRSCLKWKLQVKQSEEIFWNRSIRYSEALKDNRSFSSFFLNFLSSMNFMSSTNSSSSMNVSTMTSSWDVNKSTWQVMKVKKRRVDRSSCVISDSEDMTSEQTQKRQIRKCERFLMIKSIQKAASAQSQQQLQIILWWIKSFCKFYSTTSESH